MIIPATKKILVFSDWFDPGYKAGGPIRSCVNFVGNMQDDYDLSVLTTDRDLGSSTAYPGLKTNSWIPYGDNAEVYYCSPANMDIKTITERISEVNPDFLYLNSMFSKPFTIFPLLLKKTSKVKADVVLAPRGMLRRSAISFKPYKKKIFLFLCKSIGIQKIVHFHATDEIERADIYKYFGKQAKVTVIPNFPGGINNEPLPIEKEAGELKIIFVGRIHPIKKLDFLLSLLKKVNQHVHLTIVGSEEDKSYLAQCKAIVAGLPRSITVNFHGEVPPTELPGVMKEHHIFALPTKGENFGHAIFEALVAAKPVLISDQTPWRNLQAQKAGWDISLDNQDLFLSAIEQALSFTQQEYNVWCKGAWKYVNDYVKGSDLKKAYHNLFN